MFASFLATAAVIAFIVVNARRYQGQNIGRITDAVTMPAMNAVISALAAGVVTANGLFHFLHGALGFGDFPAPFGQLLGRGLPSDISNIVWGLFNLAVATLLALRSRKSIPFWKFTLFLVLGAAAMGLLLRFVLLAGYFNSHGF